MLFSFSTPLLFAMLCTHSARAERVCAFVCATLSSREVDFNQRWIEKPKINQRMRKRDREWDGNPTHWNGDDDIQTTNFLMRKKISNYLWNKQRTEQARIKCLNLIFAALRVVLCCAVDERAMPCQSNFALSVFFDVDKTRRSHPDKLKHIKKGNTKTMFGFWFANGFYDFVVCPVWPCKQLRFMFFFLSLSVYVHLSCV